MKALFVLTNPIEGPSERYRVLQYIPSFEREGIDCTVSSLFNSEDYHELYAPGRLHRKVGAVLAGFARRQSVLLRAGQFDVALIQRQPLFWWPGLVEALLEKAGVPYVFDLDDALYLHSPIPGNRLWALLKSPRSLPATLRGAVCVTAGNATIARHAGQYARRVEIVPTCVDTTHFEPRPLRKKDGGLVIGWIGSHTTAEAYLGGMTNVFERLAAHHPGVRFRAVGVEKHMNRLIECRPWSLETELAELADFDIGIMPMRDDEWALGKCGLKLLQYMAMGLPTVSSPVGVATEIITEGSNGLQARNPEEWFDSLSRLITSPQLRSELGRAGRATVESRYSLSCWAPRLAGVLCAAARKSPSRAKP